MARRPRGAAGGRAVRAGVAAGPCRAGAAVCGARLLCLIQGARGPVVAARRGWWFGFGLHLVGLYWITEAILIEAARFWWLVPFAVPALAAVLAVFIAAAAAVAGCARPGWPRGIGAGRRLGAGRSRAPVRRHRVSVESAGQRLGVARVRLGDILIQPACLVGVHGLTFATVLLAATPLLGWRWRVAGVGAAAALVRFRRCPAGNSRCRPARG